MALHVEEENWAPIPGFSRYEVSNIGRVRTLQYKGRDTVKVLTQRLRGTGYLEVGLYNAPKALGGRQKWILVHRLVLEAFVGECPEGHECRHLDGDKANNMLSNLKWGTSHENYLDSYNHGQRGMAAFTEDQVRDIRARYGTDGKHALAEEYGVHERTIWSCASRRTYKWID